MLVHEDEGVSQPLRLQAFLRATAAPGRELVYVPPFTVYLDRRDPLRYLNYAIPDGDVEPDAAAIDRLRDVFRARDRLPRLEWLEESAPRLASALAARGMAEELRSPLMVCSEDELIEARATADGLTIAPVGEADVRDCVNLQRVAFGQPALADGEVPGDRGAGGGGAVLARVSAQAVAAAAWTPIVGGVTEIVGVATTESWRGRGLAGAVTAGAARDAFSAGASLCVLSPGSETAQRVYIRAGFRPVATMLHWSDPA